MSNPINTRIFKLTNIILGLSILTIVISANRLDSIRERKEIDAIKMLMKANSIEQANNNGQAEEKTRRALKQSNPLIYAKHMSCRIALTQAIFKAGGREENIKRLKGNEAEDPISSFNLLSVSTIDNKKLNTSTRQYNWKGKSQIDESIEVLNGLCGPTATKITTDIDTTNLSKRLKNILKEDDFKITSVHIENDSCAIEYNKIMTYASQTDYSNRIFIPIKTVSIPNKSIIEILDKDLDLIKIYEDKDLLNTLSKKYKYFKLEEAQDYLKNKFVESYESIEIIGFKFSSNIFSVTIACIINFCLAFILISMKQNITSNKTPPGNQEEDLLSPLFSNIASTAIIWAAIPPLTILISLFINTSFITTLIASGLSVTSFVLGTIAVLYYKRGHDQTTTTEA
jgi:hypothetical protein